MTIVHSYVLRNFLRTLALTLAGLTLLFLVFDFFDHVDAFFASGASVFAVLAYFLFKLPLVANLMLPIAVLLATMLSIGIMAKNSEITAMRASGLRIGWIMRPVFCSAFALSLVSIFLSETIVPYTTRREREIYNIDIKAKDKTGSYSQSDVWWRSRNTFFSVDMFDSRSNRLHFLSAFDLNSDFDVVRRTDAREVNWVGENLGWSMQNVTQYVFTGSQDFRVEQLAALPLPIEEQPEDFYDVRTDPQTLSFSDLRRFITKQLAAGLPVYEYVADLHAKISFPFITLIVALVSLPFALKPARSGSMAGSVVAGLLIGFTYYAVHSLSMAMGRAEFLPPLLAAWMANVVMGVVGLLLNFGAEAPEGT